MDSKKLKKSKYLSVKYFSLTIISLSFLLSAYNNLPSINEVKNKTSQNNVTKRVNKNNAVKDINSRKLKPKEYLDLAESYSEEVLNTLKYRTIKPYYNKPILNATYFGTLIEGKKLNFKQATKNINQWLKLSSEFKSEKKYIYAKSLFYYLNDDYSNALLLAEKTIPDNNTKYYINLARLYEHELRFEDAINIYNKISEIDKSTKAINLRKIGDIYWNNRFYNEGFDYYSQAIMTDGNLALPFRGYYFNNLCDKMSELEKTNLNPSFLVGIEVSNSAYCKDSKIRSEYFTGMSKFDLANNQIDRSVDLGSNYADKAAFAISKNNLLEAENNFKRANFVGGNYLGDLALVQLKLKKLVEIQQTFDESLERQKMALEANVFDISKTNYDYKLYLAMLETDKENMYQNAKKMIIASPNKDRFEEITKYFDISSDEYKKLKSLNQEYDDFYQYFVRKGMALVNNNRTVERTKVLLKQINPNDNLNIQEIEKVISSF